MSDRMRPNRVPRNARNVGILVNVVRHVWPQAEGPALMCVSGDMGRMTHQICGLYETTIAQEEA